MTLRRVGPEKPRKARPRRAVSSGLAGARIHAVFQPIEDLGSGRIVGFEALARLRRGDQILSPAAFLPDLSQDELKTLFREMLGQALRLRRGLATGASLPYVTINVEVPLLLSEGFLDLLHDELGRHAVVPKGAVVLELLEGHATADFARMSERLREIQALGIAIALDDIGSAYSSLINLRDLPVDIMKLDQSFARGLRQRPHDLHFILSLQRLALSIGKRLIVEGVETMEIHDALRVLGVDFAQGYGIARPMPAEAAAAWLAARTVPARRHDRTPTSLLGAYAGHLRVVEACRTLMSQPLPVAWKEASKDPHACGIGIFLDCHKLHDTAYGLAHKRFHEVMSLYETDPVSWQTEADGFRRELERAMGEPATRFRCETAAA